MRISGLNLDAYPIWPYCDSGTDTIGLTYDPNYVATMVSGEVDKFYVADVTLTSSNYETVGTLAATNSNISATSVTLTGLSQGRAYYCLGVRFSAGGVPTGTYSNLQIVHTAFDRLFVTPANATLIMNPQTDSFFDWFWFGIACGELGLERMFDAQMGHFFRLTGAGAVNPELDARVHVSPRHNWSLEYKIRTNADGGFDQQYSAGFRSGNQARMTMEYYRGHLGPTNSEWSFLSSQWGTNYDNIATVGPDPASYNMINFETTQMSVLQPSGADNQGAILWRANPLSNHPDFNNWQFSINTVHRIRWDYNAATYEVKVYLDDVLIQTFGDTEQPLAFRKRYPVGEHYAMPIAPFLRLQYLGQQATNYIDIGEITFSTACPYAYAGWTAGRSSQYSTFGCVGETDGTDPVQWYTDPLATSMNDNFAFMWWNNADRVTVSNFVGFTLAPNPFAANDNCELLIPEEAGTWGASDWGGSRVESGKTEPAYIPNGHIPHSVVFAGVPTHDNTISGQLKNESNTALISTKAITGVYGQTEALVTPAGGTKVYPEFSIDWDASPTPVDENSLPPYAVGANIYFMPVASEAVRTGSTVTITAWANATIKYRFDGGPILTYTAPLFLTTQRILYWYAYDVSYSEDWQELIVGNLVKNPDGSVGGYIKTTDGVDGGLVKTLSNGVWI